MTNQRREGWIRPLAGGVKCNVDVTIFKDQGCYGIGIFLRGDRGEFMGAKTAWYRGLPQPNEAEARGLKEVIKWLGTLRYTSVSIELDCKQVVDGISSNLNTNSTFDAILNTCKASLVNHQNFKITLFRRQTNNVAHLLARASLYYASSQGHAIIFHLVKKKKTLSAFLGCLFPFQKKTPQFSIQITHVTNR